MRRLTLALLLVPLLTTTALARPNVLFIAIDDLRNDLGALGVAHAQTPALDQLARTGRLFSHHFVQVPTCGASRAALFRGRYPDSPVLRGNNAIRDTAATWAKVSLPGWLRSHGYRTYALGKVTHYPGGLTGGDWDAPPEELPDAWDRAWLPDTPWGSGQAIMHGYANGKRRERGVSPPWEAFDGPDHAYPDAWIADAAVTQLAALESESDPWFFAVGFFKPHLPLAAPRSWFDRHDLANIPVPPVAATARQSPGWHSSGELRQTYNDGGREVWTDEAYAAELRRAYAAAVSYVDHQVGRVLAALEASGQADNTIVVVWSDHGFQLGEHDMWAKHTLFEAALRSPLLIRFPGLPQAGVTSPAVVETVDLLPTVLDLCGLPLPETPLDGRSLRPQLENPAAPSAKPALAWWQEHRTVRDDRWRLIVYPDGGDELFDLPRDPFELNNLAEAEPAVVARLRQALR